MNANRLTLGLAGVLSALALLAPCAARAAADTAPNASEDARAYLSELSPAVAGDTLSLRLWINGEARNSVAIRPDGVQVTLEGAFLDPAKQHLTVDHPAIREVFAYQYDPDTVRVRVLTQGLPPGALRDHVALRDDGRSLVLTVSGLKAARPAPVAAAATAPAPAPEPAAAPVRKAAEVAEALDPAPQGLAPTAKAVPDPARAAARAAEARAEAMATLERLLGDADGPPEAEKAADAPADAAATGAGMQALKISRTALLPPAPNGGGAPAEAGNAAAPTPTTKPFPAPAEPLAQAKPAASSRKPGAPPAAPAAETAQAAAAPDAAPVPLKPLPRGIAAARPDLWSSGLRMAGGLIFVLGLLAIGVAVLRRVRGATLGGRTPIRVLASASLGSRQNIVVVEVEGRRLVVGVTPGGMELLADLSAAGPDGDAVDAAGGRQAAPESPFARALARAGERAGGRGKGGAERDAADALRRTTQALQRRVRRLKARTA
jgi:flagellar biosynthetic protein FliO